MKKVLTFSQALNDGYNPSEYQFNTDIPLGKHTVRLDFKIWANQFAPVVTCFCTDTTSMQKIRFNVFQNKNKEYYILNSAIDTVELLYDTEITINFELNKNGNIKIVGCAED